MEPWKRIQPTKVTKVGWRTIVTKTFQKPDGTTAVFDTMMPEGQQFVDVIAITKDNRAILIREFQTGPERISKGAPGGFVEGDESPLMAAQRELLEETGYQASQMRLLGSHCKDAYLNGTWNVVLATGCSKVAEQQLDGEEAQIEVAEVTISEFIAAAKAGEMTDTASVFLALDELQKLENAGDGK
ncbi:NUDIX hydrolase [soil metagenome]